MGVAASLPTAPLSSTLAHSASPDSTEQGECLPLVSRLPFTSPYTVPPQLWAPTFGPPTPSYTMALGGQAQRSALPDLSADLSTLLDSMVR